MFNTLNQKIVYFGASKDSTVVYVVKQRQCGAAGRGQSCGGCYCRGWVRGTWLVWLNWEACFSNMRMRGNVGKILKEKLRRGNVEVQSGSGKKDYKTDWEGSEEWLEMLNVEHWHTKRVVFVLREIQRESKETNSEVSLNRCPLSMKNFMSSTRCASKCVSASCRDGVMWGSSCTQRFIT